MPSTQIRPPLSLTVQQMAPIPMSAVLASQLASFSVAGSLSGDDDLAVCVASGGLFALTLPGVATALVGKSYWVAEIEGTNGVTVTAAGSGTIAGSGTYALAAGSAVCLVATSVDVVGDAVTWEILVQPVASGGGLLAANNLSDVVSASAARANIGANTKNLYVGRADLIAANADVLRYVHRGADLTITAIDSAITAAIDVDATITASIDGTPITTGQLTILTAGSAPGDLDTAAPSALNVLSAGSVLELTVGGGNTLVAFADCSVYGTY